MDEDLIDGPGICRMLSITPRQLHAWQARRHNSGFPEPTAERTEGARPGWAPRSRRLWKKQEIVDWHEQYVPLRGGAGMHRTRRSTGEHDSGAASAAGG